MDLSTSYKFVKKYQKTLSTNYFFAYPRLNLIFAKGEVLVAIFKCLLGMKAGDEGACITREISKLEVMFILFFILVEIQYFRNDM